AAGVAFFPGFVLPVALLVAVWLAVPASGERAGRGLVLLGAAAALAAALALPVTLEPIEGGGHRLDSTVGVPSVGRPLRLAPDGGTGSWSVAWFLPLAAVLSFTLVEGTGRPAIRYLVAAVAGVFLAWAGAAGYLPQQLSNPVAYLGVVAVAYSALVAYG